MLHDFPQSGADGDLPYGKLLMDKAGALYGVTPTGQSSSAGVVFKLAPPASGNGVWNETILHTFTIAAAGQDGETPVGGLVADATGRLFGVAANGGPSFSCGTVYMLTPPEAGQTIWAYQVLHQFAASGDGCQPEARLTMDHRGNLFGTTQTGVDPGTSGTVFEISPPAPGQTQWTERVLASFPGFGAGSRPSGALALAPDGTLYGNTTEGGRAPCHCGGVFALKPNASGFYRPSILYSFTNSPDGAYPVSDVTRDEAGNLYGTTLYGGIVLSQCKRGCGTIYKLTPPKGGQGDWTETTYATTRQYGKYPEAGVLVAADGRLYGTASQGGRHLQGTTFSLPLSVLAAH